MKSQLNLLKKHYGSDSAVAKALGITPRHFLNVRKGKYIGRFLKLQIIRLAFEIKNK
jgi:hypothetical protein